MQHLLTVIFIGLMAHIEHKGDYTAALMREAHHEQYLYVADPQVKFIGKPKRPIPGVNVILIKNERLRITAAGGPVKYDPSLSLPSLKCITGGTTLHKKVLTRDHGSVATWVDYTTGTLKAGATWPNGADYGNGCLYCPHPPQTLELEIPVEEATVTIAADNWAMVVPADAKIYIVNYAEDSSTMAGHSKILKDLVADADRYGTPQEVSCPPISGAVTPPHKLRTSRAPGKLSLVQRILIPPTNIECVPTGWP